MTGTHYHPRALQGDPANDGYVLRTVGGVPMWLPGAVPAGGTTDQVLSKVSDDDYDVTWTDAGGSGSSVGATEYLFHNAI